MRINKTVIRGRKTRTIEIPYWGFARNGYINWERAGGVIVVGFLIFCLVWIGTIGVIKVTQRAFGKATLSPQQKAYIQQCEERQGVADVHDFSWTCKQKGDL